uniref:Uncharacterized protein n=1 Tax=Physcomitrium patens TaxID=3218 RepID=A0A7I4AYA3_PHYPA
MQFRALVPNMFLPAAWGKSVLESPGLIIQVLGAHPQTKLTQLQVVCFSNFCNLGVSIN